MTYLPLATLCIVLLVCLAGTIVYVIRHVRRDARIARAEHERVSRIRHENAARHATRRVERT